MNNQCVIELTDITKHFLLSGLETQALQGVNLRINEGEYVSISGPSGCGKSTLLNILGLLDTPTGGRYQIAGNDVSQLSVNQRATLRNKHIGFVFQSFNLIDELNVFDNLALPVKYSEQPLSGSQLKERVMQCLELVQMTHRVDHQPNQLSGGQQQRIAIARALVNKPDILLIDEPTGNLDSKNGDAVMQMLHDLNAQGTTMCMVTHDPRYADMAGRKLFLLDGVMVDEVNLEMAG
ncbi:ABC transporter ATP-binding protein [Pseudoalteromonas rubra]|uniref:ABC transporter ATP-binding protein n=1 Tax=Pseudoalteromonas rubra TaxID=43658 RepID=A0A5S3WMX3_9GAMM|nr:ABC transporter ATP-binding protein [Pseudoalteromonas rubra]TMP28518.1 ABC transporter ATP-binding protein [Pseudoalteromonas rubra]TMP30485.1 ABC transporter ATP-binding protein [Pseudoalteromonas rubra]